MSWTGGWRGARTGFDVDLNTRVRDLAPHQEAMLGEILKSCRRRRKLGPRRVRAINCARYRRVKRMLEDAKRRPER